VLPSEDSPDEEPPEEEPPDRPPEGSELVEPEESDEPLFADRVEMSNENGLNESPIVLCEAA